MEQKQGFIPGDPTEKNAPYRQPLDDALISIGLDPQVVIKGDNMQNIKTGKAYIDFYLIHILEELILRTRSL